MRSGKNVQRARGNTSTDPHVSDEPRASGSSSTRPSTGNVEPEPVITDVEAELSPRTSPRSESAVYQDVLIECNTLIENYGKGKATKPAVYSGIQTKLVNALGDDIERIDAAFGSFIATVESHDSETAMALQRGAGEERERDATQSALEDVDNLSSNEEQVFKKPKVDESAFAWSGTESSETTTLSHNLLKTLKFLGIYTLDPKTTKRSLTNAPSCPEFPDSEWKNIITGKAVNLDAVLSGQLSTTNDDLKVESFRDLKFSFGAVDNLNLPKLSETEEIGASHGTELSGQQPLRSRIDCRNLQVMENTLPRYSPLRTPVSMNKSFPMTERSGNVSDL